MLKNPEHRVVLFGQLGTWFLAGMHFSLSRCRGVELHTSHHDLRRCDVRCATHMKQELDDAANLPDKGCELHSTAHVPAFCRTFSIFHAIGVVS